MTAAHLRKQAVETIADINANRLTERTMPDGLAFTISALLDAWLRTEEKLHESASRKAASRKVRA